MKRSEHQGLRLAFAGLLLLFILLPRLAGLSLSEILYDMPRAPLLAALVLLGLYALKTLTLLVPGTILHVSAGVLFPPVIALSLACVGNLLGLSIGYLMGRMLGRESVAALLSKNRRTALFLEKSNRSHVKSCLVARLMPLPVELCSLFFGAVGVSFRSYLAASLSGLLPRTTLGVLAGALMDHPASYATLLPLLLCLSLSCGLLIWIWRVEGNKQNFPLLLGGSGEESL